MKKNIEVLGCGATAPQLEQAAAYNHTELFCLNALSVDGEVHQAGGVTFTHGRDLIDSMIAFPNLEEDRAGGILDEIVEYYLAHPPCGVGCWSLDPPNPKDLGVRLLARGFQPGWCPNWMALNLEELRLDHPVPDELLLVPDNSLSLEKIPELPYGDTNLKIFSEQKGSESTLQRFIGIWKGEIVAHCSVLLTQGSLGAAGIYHVGVLPRARNLGIGKAIVGTACKYAKEQGYNYALLNGTGDKMYQQLGFKKLGNGHTWWLVPSRLIAHPPTKNEIVLAEAIGRGDKNAFKMIADEINAYDLNVTLTNGMTPMQLAVHCRETVSAEWLISLGISVNVIDAWQLGWIELATSMLFEHPEQVNVQYGEAALTMLHMAAERNDVKLAMLALTAKPDLEIKDKTYQSTALHWASYLKRKEIVALIEKHLSTY